MYSRRDFGKVALAGLPASWAFAAAINSKVNGVELGAITYSFRDMLRTIGQDSIDTVIKDCTECGAGWIELMCNDAEPSRTTGGGRRGGGRGAGRQGGAPPPDGAPAGSATGQPQQSQVVQAQVMPPAAGGAPAAGASGGGGPRGGRTPNPEALKAREELRQWRLTTPPEHFKAIRKRFQDAGMTLYAYVVNGMGDDFTSEEIDKMFEQAKALGVSCISSSTQLTVAEKLVPFAEKHKFRVAFHGHDQSSNPNEFATPETFAKAMAMSKYYRINLDIGHFTAAGYDAVPFIQEHHAQISHMHIKDRKKNVAGGGRGANLPWGTGDTPIKQVLTLLKEKKYPIPALIELEYQVPEGSTSVEEAKKCMAYMRSALA